MKTQNKAFTLLELLVTLGIIAALSALLFPAFHMASKTAKKTKASSEEFSILSGITRYYNEYGCLPDIAGVTTESPLTADQLSDLYSVLNGSATVLGNNVQSLNPRAIKFCEVNGKIVNGKTMFIDPWGNPYGIILDQFGDFLIPWNGKGVSAKSLIWSTVNKSSKTNDFVRSWEK